MTQVRAPKSKAETTNPKDLIGSTKVSLTKFPAIGTIMGAMAMMDGASKYGPYNWRDKEVIASIYVDAAMRHMMDWWEGQEQASDSLVHHLGHAIACCAILLDAQATGNLVDDRPLLRNERGDVVDGDWLARLLDKLSATIKAKQNGTVAPVPFCDHKLAPLKDSTDEICVGCSKVFRNAGKKNRKNSRKPRSRKRPSKTTGHSQRLPSGCDPGLLAATPI